MLNDILIYRDLTVFAGQVLVPPVGTYNTYNGVVATQATGGLMPIATAEAILPTATDIIIGQSCSETTGRKQGRQRILRLAGVAPGQWYASDPIAALRADTIADITG